MGNKFLLQNPFKLAENFKIIYMCVCEPRNGTVRIDHLKQKPVTQDRLHTLKDRQGFGLNCF